MIFCERPNDKVTSFQLLVADYLQFVEQQTLNFFSAVMPLQLQYKKINEKKNNSRK